MVADPASPQPCTTGMPAGRPSSRAARGERLPVLSLPRTRVGRRATAAGRNLVMSSTWKCWCSRVSRPVVDAVTTSLTRSSQSLMAMKSCAPSRIVVAASHTSRSSFATHSNFGRSEQAPFQFPVSSSSACLPYSSSTILASSAARVSLYKIALRRACPDPSSRIRSCI
eukprot:441983-Hanusia_phi.AAC.1